MLQHKEIERQRVVKGEGTHLYLFTCAGLYLDVKLIHTKDLALNQDNGFSLLFPPFPPPPTPQGLSNSNFS